MKPFYFNVAAAIRRTSALKNLTLSFLFLIVSPGAIFAQQAVTGIITDYNSYWKTSVTAVNPVKPVNDHNVLAFTYNNTEYSTGVNDALLTSKGETYVAGDFWSLPVEGYSGIITSNTKVGVGEMFDGVHNGFSATPPVNSITRYLTDGIKGLNIGTCIANLPVGALTFIVNSVTPSSIGDGVPDILVTQVADPSGSFDSYSFLDENGNVLGNSKNIVFTSIAPVATWTADFYEASSNPMVLAPGFTNTDRPMRLWAADLSDFGITAVNYQHIRKFQINLSGNSDVAFAAYNNKTFSLQSTLPVKLTDFVAKESNGKTELSWFTQTESNSHYFIVEKSINNNSFVSIDTVTAAGNSSVTKSYTSTDTKPAFGSNYYRLKMVDADGRSEYSKTVLVTNNVKLTGLSIYPNPAADRITVTHSTQEKGIISIFNTQGMLIKKIMTDRSDTQNSIDISSFTKGIYCLVLEGATEKTSRFFIVK